MNEVASPRSAGVARMGDLPHGATAWDASALATTLLTPTELRDLTAILDALLDRGREAYNALDVLGRVRSGPEGAAFKTLVLHVNRAARDLDQAVFPAARAHVVRSLKHLRERLAARAEALAATDGALRPAEPAAPPARTVEAAITLVYQTTVHRSPAPSEVAVWKSHLDNGLPFHEFLLAMRGSKEATGNGTDGIGLQGGTDGRFVQLVHEHTQGRGAGASEINHWLVQLETGQVNRQAVLSQLFMAGVNWEAEIARAPRHDGLSCRIMGTTRDLSAAEWARQAGEILPRLESEPPAKAGPEEPRDARYRHRFPVEGPPRPLVSAITSLYRGGRFIERFMENITSQEGFDDYCELVIVDADSPEGEAATIRRYMERHRNINYIRVNHRIGIYDAWNVGAQAAKGKYLTNANLDDLRRADSFMLQAGTLEALSFVDVVYQDLYYTFDPDLPFEAIAAFGHQTSLPVLTLHNMVQFNSPHNAPMWRKSLHDEIGYFDIHYKSAGDYEFWFRCLEAGKQFYKINDPHVAYYQNPEGLSTRPGSRGLREALEIHRRYCRKLMPEEITMPTEEFARRLHPRGGGVVPSNRYRYGMAQQALRTVARNAKFAGKA